MFTNILKKFGRKNFTSDEKKITDYLGIHTGSAILLEKFYFFNSMPSALNNLQGNLIPCLFS